jgi:hypothetical protein
MLATSGQVQGERRRDSWHPARLIPTVGIKGQEGQERRATSSLLAVMRAVPESGHALLKELRAPKSAVIGTFAEVRFRDSSGRVVIPDGASVYERGKKTWTSSVELALTTVAAGDRHRQPDPRRFGSGERDAGDARIRWRRIAHCRGLNDGRAPTGANDLGTSLSDGPLALPRLDK